MLYDAFKKKVNGSLIKADYKELQKAALDAFDGNNKSYKLIKKEYLTNKDSLYLSAFARKKKFYRQINQISS